MNIILVLIVGVLVGALTGGGLFFEKNEPYKVETLLATIIRNTLVSLLAGFSLKSGNVWWLGIGFGALYGLSTVLVVFLAEGGFKKSKDAPYILIGGIITGAIIGLLDSALAVGH